VRSEDVWFGANPAKYKASLKKGAAGPSNGDETYIISNMAYRKTLKT
jgi:hypothetical protein